MRFRTVKNDENFKVQLRKMDVEEMVSKCVSCGVGSIFGSNFVRKIFSIIRPSEDLEILAVAARTACDHRCLCRNSSKVRSLTTIVSGASAQNISLCKVLASKDLCSVGFCGSCRSKMSHLSKMTVFGKSRYYS